MPRSLTSKTSDRFASNTEEALSRSGAVHKKDPFQGMPSGDVPFPNMPSTINQNPETLRNAISGGLISRNVGNSSNIVVDPVVFNDSIRRMNSMDNHIGAEVHGLLREVEEMCATIFHVPAVARQIKNFCDEVTRHLGRFQDTTDSISIETKRFVGEMAQIDHGNTGQIAISQMAVSQAIQQANSAINRQTDNMQRTVQNYNRQVERLNGETEREERNVERLQRELERAQAAAAAAAGL